MRVDEIGARGEVSSPTVRLGIRADRYLSEFFGGWSFSDDFIYNDVRWKRPSSVIPEEPTDTQQIDSEFEIWILNRSKDAAFDD